MIAGKGNTELTFKQTQRVSIWAIYLILTISI